MKNYLSDDEIGFYEANLYRLILEYEDALDNNDNETCRYLKTQMSQIERILFKNSLDNEE